MDARDAVRSTLPALHGGPLGSRDRIHPVRLDFSVSLNAWGPAEAVLKAVREAPVDHYPDPECLAPREAAARRWQRPSAEIAFGAGAAELIQAVCFAYLRPDDTALLPSPSFGEYARAAALCGARVETVHADPETLRLDAMEMAATVGRTRPRIAFLCAPNNPTGQSFSKYELRAVADACADARTLLVLDQSYDAFPDAPLGTPALPGHPATLHLRSITKDHALAGVRAAFALGPPEVVEMVDRCRVPWSASAAAQAAAVAALSDAGEAHLRETLPRLRDEHARLERRLSEAGFGCVPSSTHFLLFRAGDAATVARRLRTEHGIAVRDCTSFGLPAYLRVAARRPSENDTLIEALATIPEAERTPRTPTGGPCSS